MVAGSRLARNNSRLRSVSQRNGHDTQRGVLEVVVRDCWEIAFFKVSHHRRQSEDANEDRQRLLIDEKSVAAEFAD